MDSKRWMPLFIVTQQLCTTDTGLPPTVQTNRSSYSHPNRGNTAPPMTFWVFKLCLQGLQVDFLRCPHAERGKDTWRKRMERQEVPLNCSCSRGHGNVTCYLSKDSFPRLLACSSTPNVCQSSQTMVERKSMPLYFICQGCMVNPLVRNRAWIQIKCQPVYGGGLWLFQIKHFVSAIMWNDPCDFLSINDSVF